MYEALMFLLIWYSVSTTLFQMIRSKIFISDCVVFFDTIATFVQTIAGWGVLIGKNVAQISNGISNPVVAGIIYWLIRILICGGCLVGAGIFLAFIGIKIVGLYKKYCGDSITIMVILISMATAIYFGKWIKTTLPINLQRRAGLSTAARMAPFILTVDWLGWLCYCLVVNTNRNDCCNHFRDPKRIPDANGPEKTAE